MAEVLCIRCGQAVSVFAEDVQVRFWSLKVRTDGAVMDGLMIFGDIVAKIDSSRFPKMAKLALSCSAAEPMATHVHIFEAFAGNVVGDNSMRCCIASLHGRGWLFVDHIFKSIPGGKSLAAVYEKGGKLGLCSRGHDGLDDLGGGHDGSVVGWSDGISGHEKMSACLTQSFLL